MATTKHESHLYSIQASDNANALVVKEVATTGAIDAGYTNLQPVAIAGKTYIIGYGKDSLDLWELTTAAPWLKKIPQKLKVGKGYTIVDAFTIGDAPAVMCYEPKAGIMKFFPIKADISISGSYEFYRNHAPGVTKNFTTLKSFVSLGGVAFLGYDGTNGYVALYAFSVTATPVTNIPKATAPYLMTPTWDHRWAPGWTRFAFFELGGETFFLKTNTAKPNVNIDHVLDGLASGTTEVGTELDDPHNVFLKYTDVQAFTLAHGDPYFVTYEKGALTFNHIWPDCQGWDAVAKAKSKPGATQMIPISAGGTAYLLVY